MIMSAVVRITFCLILTACSSDVAAPTHSDRAEALRFGSERFLGESDKNPSTPFLRFAPDGRLFAIWTEDDDRGAPQAKHHAAHQHQSTMKMPLSPIRAALLASSADGGKTWSPPKRINDSVEAIEGEEGGPKFAFGKDNRVYAVWSIPNDKGDKTRANIRFAMEDGNGGFMPARMLIRDIVLGPVTPERADEGLKKVVRQDK
jgi:hypothetical protein